MAARAVEEEESRPLLAEETPSSEQPLALPKAAPTLRWTCTSFLYLFTFAVFLVPLVLMLGEGAQYSGAFCKDSLDGDHSILIQEDRRLVPARGGFLASIVSLAEDSQEEDQLCRVRVRTAATWFCAAILLLLLKFASFESCSAIGRQMIGSTDAARRPMPYGLLFRLVAMWGFWGIFIAVIATIWGFYAQFVGSGFDDNFDFVAVRTGDPDEPSYFMVNESMAKSATLSSLEDEGCWAFGSYHDIRFFAHVGLGIGGSLTFCLGALLFGLGEIFKLDFAKDFMLGRYWLNAGALAFCVTALAQDSLVAGFNNLYGKFQRFKSKYGKDVLRLQEEMEKMESLSLDALYGPARVFEDMGKRVALRKARPFVEQYLKESGSPYTWEEDVLPALETLDSVEEIAEAVKDPAKFVNSFASNTLGPAARKLALLKVGSLATPYLAKYDLDWTEDVLPIVQQIDDIEELKQAAEDTPAFLERLADCSLHLAWKQGLKALRPQLEPKLPAGISWDEVKEELTIVFERVDTVQEAKELCQDPDRVLKELGPPLARRVALKALRPKLEPLLEKQQVSWDDAVGILDELDTVEELQQLVEDPQQFMDRIVKKSGPIAKKWAMAQLKKLLEPKLKQKGLQWDDMLIVIERLDEPGKIEAAVKDPAAFFDGLGEEVWPVAVRFGLAQLRPKLEEKLTKEGIVWKDVQARVAETIGNKEELEAFAKDPVTKLKEVLERKIQECNEEELAESNKACNGKQRQKLVWPAVLQAAAAALWLFASLFNVSGDCVGFSDQSTSILMGLYVFHDEWTFTQFVAAAHIIMVALVVLLLLLAGLLRLIGRPGLQARVPGLIAITLAVYCIVLSTYKQGKEEGGGEQAASSAPTPAPAPAAASSSPQMPSVPLGAFVIGAGLTEGAVRAGATAASEPSKEELVTHRVDRDRRVAEKAAQVAAAAPPGLKLQATAAASRTRHAAMLAVKREEQRVEAQKSGAADQRLDLQALEKVADDFVKTENKKPPPPKVSENQWCAVARNTPFGDVPGRVWDVDLQTCYYAFGGKCYSTKDFTWVKAVRKIKGSDFKQLQPHQAQGKTHSKDNPNGLWFCAVLDAPPGHDYSSGQAFGRQAKGKCLGKADMYGKCWFDAKDKEVMTRDFEYVLSS